jgi:hypothetical protein
MESTTIPFRQDQLLQQEQQEQEQQQQQQNQEPPPPQQQQQQQQQQSAQTSQISMPPSSTNPLDASVGGGGFLPILPWFPGPTLLPMGFPMPGSASVSPVPSSMTTTTTAAAAATTVTSDSATLKTKPKSSSSSSSSSLSKTTTNNNNAATSIRLSSTPLPILPSPSPNQLWPTASTQHLHPQHLFASALPGMAPPPPPLAPLSTTVMLLPLPPIPASAVGRINCNNSNTNNKGTTASWALSSSVATTPMLLIPTPHPLFRTCKLRSGKWLPEEEIYASLLIDLFEKGLIQDCENGATLRFYLSIKLHCQGMRISKKHAGKSIGKMIYLSKHQHPRPPKSSASKSPTSPIPPSTTKESADMKTGDAFDNAVTTEKSTPSPPPPPHGDTQDSVTNKCVPTMNDDDDEEESVEALYAKLHEAEIAFVRAVFPDATTEMLTALGTSTTVRSHTPHKFSFVMFFCSLDYYNH